MSDDINFVIVLSSPPYVLTCSYVLTTLLHFTQDYSFIPLLLTVSFCLNFFVLLLYLSRMNHRRTLYQLESKEELCERNEQNPIL